MNVIVIVTDSMRADHLGCHPCCTSHNGKRVQTPNLDKLTTESMLFEQAYGGSLPTIPMRTDCWTGRFGFPFHTWQPFRKEDCLLAEVLWDKGYASALVTDVYHMHKPVFNCGRGFDNVVFVRGQEYDPYVVDDSVSVDLAPWHRLRHGQDKATSDDLWKPRFEQYLRNRTSFGPGDDSFVSRVIKEAAHWLERMVKVKGRKDDLFLWVDCFDPHEPWDPPEPFWSMYAGSDDDQVQPLIDPVPGLVAGYMSDAEVRRTFSLYAGLVSCVDKWVGELLGTIGELGLHDNTMVMHISDHGEPFGEHGVIRKARPWLYEELTHIPWSIRHPEGIGAGQRSTAFVQPADMMPTILDFLDVSGASSIALQGPRKGSRQMPQDHTLATFEATIQGRSLLPLMRGDVESIRDFAYSGMGQQWAIRSPEWSYLLPLKPDAGRVGKPELYNRSIDLAEQNDVLAAHPDVAEHLENELRRWAG